MNGIRMEPLRAPWTPPAGSREAQVLDAMWLTGEHSYVVDIMELHDEFYGAQAEAGPGHEHCEVLKAKLDRMDQRIKEIVGSALDHSMSA